MIVLGIDTSLRSSGYGVLLAEGSSMRALEMGTIRNAPKVPLSGCLRNIHATVAGLIERHHPDVLAIESVIYGKNAGTMLVLGEARGAVLAAAANALEKYGTDVLPVRDRRGKFMGFVSAEDIFRLYRGMVRERDSF